MENQEQQDSSQEEQDGESNGGLFGKATGFLYLIGGVILFMGIMVVMPMIFTYFSNGSLRP
jgi:hypothetical protein